MKGAVTVFFYAKKLTRRPPLPKVSSFEKCNGSAGLVFIMKRVVVFGGSGFVGRYITKKLANLNCVIKIVCRDLDAANQLKVCGNLGQISASQCDLSDEKSIKKTLIS